MSLYVLLYSLMVQEVSCRPKEQALNSGIPEDYFIVYLVIQSSQIL